MVSFVLKFFGSKCTYTNIYRMGTVELLFGAGDGQSPPWHAYHMCECKEVNQNTIDLLLITLGELYGPHHDSHGYIIDMNLWNALLQYVHWCESNQCSFEFHVSKVLEGDAYYRELAQAHLQNFGAD